MTGNRLGREASAYLLSAAHQPIHWYSWGPEAFEAAKANDRPVLLDIGAVWCHWCHVMDGESYDDPELAEYLNEHFVCIKVDRDARPDVDARYQRAVQAFSGQGGWPLTAFLNPDGEVFYGGTYFPPDGRYGRPGFRSVLARVLEVYRTRRDDVREQAASLRRLLAENLDEAKTGDVAPALLDHALEHVDRAFDPVHGGFGQEPKFPHPAAIGLLLSRWYDARQPRVREIIETTLTRMGRGGVYDQLGGGFHRYSVDRRWIVPHFEKMAYDNAELLRCYVEAHVAFGNEEYARVAQGIIAWVRDTASDPDGGYAASQDADVGLNDDGDYFTWTRDEAAAVLSPDEFEVAAAYYDIGTAGDMHHNPSKNVLFVTGPLERLALAQGRTPQESEALLASARAKLRRARDQRPRPFVDHTRYTNWNAMMAGAMLQAGVVLGQSWARTHALTSLERLRQEHPARDIVGHMAGGNERLLEDQVHLARATLDAYETTGDRRWLEWSEALMDRVWDDHWDTTDGGLFDVATGVSGEGLLPTRAKPIQDAPTPSPNGTAGIVWARLFAVTAAPRHRDRRDALLRAFAGSAPSLGLHGATYFQAVDWALNPATHMVIVGETHHPAVSGLLDRAHAAALPRRVIQRLSPGGEATARFPEPMQAMLRAAGGSESAPRAYACVGTRCLSPATTLVEWDRTLRALEDPESRAPSPVRGA